MEKKEAQTFFKDTRYTSYMNLPPLSCCLVSFSSLFLSILSKGLSTYERGVLAECAVAAAGHVLREYSGVLRQMLVAGWGGRVGSDLDARGTVKNGETHFFFNCFR